MSSRPGRGPRHAALSLVLLIGRQKIGTKKPAGLRRNRIPAREGGGFPPRLMWKSGERGGKIRIGNWKFKTGGIFNQCN